MIDVTVGVLTYNAESTVLETLDSVLNQSYSIHQLIISDDASSDRTVQRINNWLEESQARVLIPNVTFLTQDYNKGVSANCNRVIEHSKSDFIKFIAGDDILLPNCIEDNANYISLNPDANVVFSQVGLYDRYFTVSNFIGWKPEKFPDNLMDPTFTPNDQWKILLQSDRITYTPSYFFNKTAVEKVGFYDESDRLVEDYPMWLKLTSSGIKLHYFHIPTVGYRIHEKATNNVGGDRIFKPSAINGYRVRRKYAHPYLPFRTVLVEKWVFGVNLLFQKFKLNKKYGPFIFLHRLLTIYTNPFFLYNAIYKRVNRQVR